MLFMDNSGYWPLNTLEVGKIHQKYGFSCFEIKVKYSYFEIKK